ncbi:hypothetical protein [Micromonospora sp. CPCC 206061]|uniref:hypothetical protein n=1 Tax=Micromonospora sp. CPCC 206061 TaxID=3122410 RepID=UPI002FF1EDF1
MIDDVDLDGIVVPGLRGTFHRRAEGAPASTAPEGGLISTVGLYSYAGIELFMAWGYVGEAHCRYTALRGPDGSWGPPLPGCPPVSKVCDGGLVTALTLGGYVLPAAPMTSPPPVGTPATVRVPAARPAVGGLGVPPPAACAADSGS